MPPGAVDTRERLFLGVVSSMAAGLVLWGMQDRLGPLFAVGKLIDPRAVSAIADQVEGATEDEWVYDAWDLVGSTIDYQGFGSDLEFVDSHIRCQRCYLPMEVVKSGASNCVGKSALLASILRNRLPAERVEMVVGYLANGSLGGHAWVEVQLENGRWYLLEATQPPKGWLPVELSGSRYLPAVYLNDQQVDCQTDDFCVSIAAGCGCEQEPWAH